MSKHVSQENDNRCIFGNLRTIGQYVCKQLNIEPSEFVLVNGEYSLRLSFPTALLYGNICLYENGGVHIMITRFDNSGDYFFKTFTTVGTKQEFVTLIRETVKQLVNGDK